MARGVEQCVRGLDVTVDEPALMGGIERVGELRKERERVCRRQRTVFPNERLQVVPST